MKSIFITGADGFIGRNLAKFFFKKNYKIFGISRSEPEKENLNYFVEYINNDLMEKEMGHLLKRLKPDLIFHCAGSSSIQTSIINPLKDFNDNTYVTFKLLNWIKNYVPKSKIYFFSSAAVYGNPDYLPIKESHFINPISPYGYHKLISENICKEFSEIYSLNIVILRIFSVYGPGLKRQIFYDLAKKFEEDEEVFLRGSGDESRDFINIYDLCRAIELIIQNNNNLFEIYNIGSGEEISIKEIAIKFSEFLKSTKNINFDLQNSDGMPLNWRADISKLKNIGFQKSFEISEGVKEYISWFKKINF
tara:strand:- start:58 stop:975 length:918 start_codon:yes stop_codon:yes gene_type:complete